PGFGTGGEATLDNAGGSSLVIQTDDKFLVGGTRFGPGFGTADVPTLARFNPDGTPDLGYGSNAVVTNFGIQGGDTGDLALLSSGKALILTFGFHTSEVTRFNADGSIDALFGNAGQVLLGSDTVATESFPAQRMAVQPDGRIVVESAVVGVDAGFGMMRLN